MDTKFHILCCAIVFTIIFHNGLTAKVQFQNVSTDFTDNIYIYIIQGPSYNDSVKLKLEDGLELTNFTFFDPDIDTLFYYHGWAESIRSFSVETVTNALLQNHSINIAIFDYSMLVRGNITLDYIGAYFNTSKIGKAIGQYLQQYIPAVQQLHLIHLVGHSMGSQIMSKTARAYGAGILPWLTALDPAGPIFNMPLHRSLKATDAVFVDVIHTDGKFYGDNRRVGTVDFFPNRGTRYQSFCLTKITEGFCSHHTSWRYYAESIKNSTAFIAKKCERDILCDADLSFCECTNETTIMGYNVNKSATGTFYLTTNKKSPYGQGTNGINFDKRKKINVFTNIRHLKNKVIMHT